MSYFFALILICILVWMFFGERIKRWAQRRMMEKMEDAFRARMGMPSAKEERKRRKKAEKEAAAGTGGRAWRTREDKGRSRAGGAYRGYSDRNTPIIPKEYAEDVEFVEYKEFTTSSTTIESEVTDKGKFRRKNTTEVENQVTDVEFVEIKNK